MSKSTSKKSGSSNTAKVPSAYADKQPVLKAARDNDSKYQPTDASSMDTQLLDPRDGVLKLFADSIKELYWAENHLVKTLPKMIKSASSKTLQDAIENHLEQTKMHVERLEHIFGLLPVTIQARKCDAMEGLTKEGEGVIECTDVETPARNLGIIMASQKVEHYEISAYTGLANLAEKLGLGEISRVLSQTLAEEQEADRILAGIADTGIEIEE
jgi:ferritin-like metal-binding protein YciE